MTFVYAVHVFALSRYSSCYTTPLIRFYFYATSACVSALALIFAQYCFVWAVGWREFLMWKVKNFSETDDDDDRYSYMRLWLSHDPMKDTT